MKSTMQIVVALLYGGLGLSSAFAQAFSSGSDGTYGPINLTSNTTLAVPANGIFNCTTINVPVSRTLSFTKNALNTPVYLLATGDITIAGAIDVSGRGGNAVVGGESGPGGFNGGSPASVSVPPGAGYGPGAAKGGSNSTQPDGAGPGAYSQTPGAASTNKGAVYGSALLVPLVGGSGGGGTAGTPGTGGGGGGGALLLASNTRIDITGTLNADGGSQGGAAYNSGSGGAIRLVAPAVTGNGSLRVFSGGGNGSAGRIRVDTLNRTGLALGFNPAGITSIGSMMLVFPTPIPRLDVIEAAGTAIPVGSGPVFVQLPFGSSSSRTVKIQASDFNDLVPINVVLTPDNGSPTVYQAEIDNRVANPAQVVVSVTVPVNVQTAVNAWTR